MLSDGVYELRVRGFKGNTISIKSRVFSETWDLDKCDPERLDQEKLPIQFRRRIHGLKPGIANRPVCDPEAN